MPKRQLEAKSREDRAKIRKQMGPLRSSTVQPVTRQRYDSAKQMFFKYLDDEKLILPTSSSALDVIVADYIEHLWASGEGRSQASNILAALQDTQPHLKGRLAQSWRLLKAWNTNEIPSRAPPFPKEVVDALVGYALFKGEPLFAFSLLMGFHGLLRTGEILAIRKSQITISSSTGPAVLSLGLTKSGKRQGAAESVTFHDQDVCRRIAQWVSSRSSRTLLAGPSHHWRKQFQQFLAALSFADWDFRPYSLRRGGSTFYFGQHGSLDRLLVAGRWQNAKTARINLNDGLAVLAQISLKWTPFAKNMRSQYLQNLQKALPQLEQGAKQGRETRKRNRKSKTERKQRRKNE